jgi:hypothetical protein
MATYQSSIVSAEPIFLDPKKIAAQIIREVFPQQKRPVKRIKPIYCACGCGKPVRIVDGKPNRYVNHHETRIVRRRRHYDRINPNTIEILRDAKAGQVQLYASRKSNPTAGTWVFASIALGLREADDRRVQFARIKPYVRLSDERTTSRYWVFDVDSVPTETQGEMLKRRLAEVS